MQESLLNIYSQPFPLESLIAFLSMFVALGTIVFLWKFRNSSEAKYLILIEVSAAIWALTTGFRYLAGSIEYKKLWSEISYLGIAFLPVCYFLFTTAYSQKTKNLTTLKVLFLIIIPLITIPLVFTNDYHELIWQNVHEMTSTTEPIIPDYGNWFWIFWVYCYFLIIAGIYNLIISMFKFTSYYKSQIIILLIATLIPMTGNIIYITNLNPIPGFDWTPVLFVFTGLMISYGIKRYRMFNLVPFARDTLINTMSDGIIILNTDEIIEDSNPAIENIFKFDEPVKHKKFSTVFKKYDSFVNAVVKGKNTLLEIDSINNERRRIYQVRVKPIYNRYKQFSGYLIQLNNVTSLKNTENSFKQVNQKLEAEVEERGRLIEDLNSFAHTVAHDLKNSLGSIYNVAEIIEECIKTGNSEMLSEFSGDIKSSAMRAIHITHELLLLATVNHNEIDKAPLDMSSIFNKACQQLGELIKETNTKIDFPQVWPQANGYAPWVEVIWVNYLTNAIKYGGNTPEISVGAEEGIHYARFWIQDNGNGVSPDDQEKLFKKYSRLNPEKAEGYGLGLSIVKRIAQKLGGYVGVESTGIKGEGSRFWFELPIVSIEAPAKKMKVITN